VTQLPMTPERVLKAINAAKSETGMSSRT